MWRRFCKRKKYPDLRFLADHLYYFEEGIFVYLMKFPLRNRPGSNYICEYFFVVLFMLFCCQVGGIYYTPSRQHYEHYKAVRELLESAWESIENSRPLWSTTYLALTVNPDHKVVKVRIISIFYLTEVFPVHTRKQLVLTVLSRLRLTFWQCMRLTASECLTPLPLSVKSLFNGESRA